MMLVLVGLLNEHVKYQSNVLLMKGHFTLMNPFTASLFTFLSNKTLTF